jgi:hypothetical protein
LIFLLSLVEVAVDQEGQRVVMLMVAVVDQVVFALAQERQVEEVQPKLLLLLLVAHHTQ